MIEASAKGVLAACDERDISIGECTLREECERSGKSRERLLARMEEMLFAMRASVRPGLGEPLRSTSGLTGGDAFRYHRYCQDGEPLCGPVIASAAAMALSVSEYNAAMGRIVACPTAGSCGIVPAALLSVGEQRGKSDGELVMALFTASGVGELIAQNATIAGAQGGCQAECGSASAMAAAALVELMGGSPRQAFHAAAMSIKTVLGLVCDPVGGLVEIPCIKRNASGVANAILCADLALGGVESYIPFDDTVSAMDKVGRAMPAALRETALGGLAATEAGQRLAQKIKK
ncbi:MAG: L-serine ammonia-lyase, iron-sulfur-dependent, subunit alpha [Clostridiales bacterium]|uniref:L-serine ammonia-lyase, iron-sulfur-dependent, subunit alpha n=1 Tax=Oscillospiraceae TaxID=216572 RepID=UPI0009A8D067|nr:MULTISPECIES: L-serine ammonia-lyase, iron-sulfur-dependent, subunit alpha [Oscillospiraceae]PWM39732.1 MAG: L-serine ammonia-lyase, iron-sulfur-dependent, subunit alpha [Clostridiales bacterium]RGB65575.1 L-serine ammonia-lyase, iron-sulfur-dependent, subunit alpha [Harryflintia acetispora]